METDAATAGAAAAPAPAQHNHCPNKEAAAQGLHSPPDSNGGPKPDGSETDLSDIDDVMAGANGPRRAPDQDEEEDIGEVLPAEWSGTVPVFRPTMKQFKDFKLFMEKVDRFGMTSGIIKIIPPEEWKASLPPLDDLVKTIKVREPIKQDIMGSNGTYRQVNIVHGRSYNLPQWRALCDQSEHQPPARRGERRANAEKPKPPRTRAAANKLAAEEPASASSPKNATRGRGRGRGRRGRGGRVRIQAPQDVEAAEGGRPMTPVSPKPQDAPMPSVEAGVDPEHGPDAQREVRNEEDATPRAGRTVGIRQARPKESKTQSTSARRKYSRREGSAAVDEKAFESWDYRMDISEYTPERCEELERIYWKTLTYAPPLYGADLMGTLFDDRTELWNLNKLPNLLDVLGTKVPGVNTAYLYLGMWKATFAWHLEDVDLYSINYLHFGAPKQWYSISQADARRFEAAMRSIWPTEAKACDQFLRHKGFLISPSHLFQHYNIRVNKCLSYPGEFVVTYPYGYHSGYNLGYNCAEAVNFALDSWLPMGKIAKKCECAQAQDSVWVDVYEIERRLRGEVTEYEETDEEDDESDEEDERDGEENGLPTPPSHHASAKVKAGAGKVAKIKRAGTSSKDKSSRKVKVKKVKVRSKALAESPCCLCPNDIPGAELLPTEDGRLAHRMCALYIAETSIETMGDREVVVNADKLGNDRLALKCLYCRSKKGACFQCSQRKCARAYHATCAAAAGVFVEDGEVPIIGEDGTEYKEQALEFSCRFHRTKRDKRLDGAALEACTRTRDAAAAARKGDIVQMQYHRGDIFAGVVAANNHSEQTLTVDIIPNGDRVEVEWKWLLLPDPVDFHLPKASAAAIPMPTSRIAKDKINATKRPAQEMPKPGAPFVNGYTWAEFNSPDVTIRNKSQAKVEIVNTGSSAVTSTATSTDTAAAAARGGSDGSSGAGTAAVIRPSDAATSTAAAPQGNTTHNDLASATSTSNSSSSPETPHLWHYIYQGSTDTKDRYTEDPANPKHNPKSVFLDTLPKQLPPVVSTPVPIPVLPPHALPQPSISRPTTTTPTRAPASAAPNPGIESTAAGPISATTTSSATGSGAGSSSNMTASTSAAAKKPKALRPEKPYVYKPRNPVPPNSDDIFTHKTFSSRKKVAAPRQLSDTRFDSKPLPSGPTFTAQRFEPALAHGYNPRYSLSLAQQLSPGSPTQAQTPAGSTPTPPAAVHAAAASPGNGWPIAQVWPTSNATESARQEPTHEVVPSVHPQAVAKHHGPPLAAAQGNTAPHQFPQLSQLVIPQGLTRGQPVREQGQAARQAPAVHEQRKPYHRATMQQLMEKYSFFRENYSRDPITYKTPYATNHGFTNGYEGNFRAHVMATHGSLFGGKPTISPSPTATQHASPPPLHSGQASTYATPRQQPAVASVSTPAHTPSASQPSHRSTTLLQPVRQWGIKQPGSAPLHPAIRPQYQGVVGHGQQQAPLSQHSVPHPSPQPVPRLETEAPSQQTALSPSSGKGSATSQTSQPSSFAHCSPADPPAPQSNSNKRKAEDSDAVAGLPHPSLRTDLASQSSPQQQAFESPRSLGSPATPASGAREFPRVEPNSMALMEKIMANLRKASERTRQ